MNPQKYSNKINLESIHRIIVVVFIPDQTEYYKGIFEIFKLNINSLVSTSNDQARITIVNNGCISEVVDYLNELFFNGVVDQIIHHKTNIGKMDALIGAARTAREELITITDVDILFKYGWQQAVESVFHSFNMVGSVSPISTRSSLHYVNSSTLKRILFKQTKFKWEEIPENINDYDRFKNSFGHNQKTASNALWPVVYKNDKKALLGSDHQVLTFRKEILYKTVPTQPSLTYVAQGSERFYIDQPIDQAGLMRLSTYNNFAYHMGNTPEKWMYEIQSINDSSVCDYHSEKIPTVDIKRIPLKAYRFQERIFTKLFKWIYKSEQKKYAKEH